MLRALGPCRRVGPGACQAMARRGVPRAAQYSPAEPLKEPAAEQYRPQAGFCQAEAAAAELSAPHSGQAKALHRRERGSLADASALRLRAHAAALPAESGKRAAAAAQAGVAESAQREAVPLPEEQAVAAGQHGAVPGAAERAVSGQRAAALRPEEAAAAALVAAVGPQPGAAEVVPGAAAEPLPEVAEAEPGAAAELQPEAVVEAERDEAARPRAAEPGAAGLPQAVPSVPPSASVCRPGRLRPRALPPALRPAARSARGRRSLLSAAPKWRWWQAAQVEV